MRVTKEKTQVQLFNDSFSPTEVSNLLLKSIDNQINGYTLKNLSNWIHDHNCDQKYYRNKIQQLKTRRKELMNIIEEAKSAGCNLKLTDNLNISLESNHN